MDDVTFDPSDMAGAIEGTPDQIEFALGDRSFPTIKGASVGRVIVVGMGGSALPADVLVGSFTHDLTVPVEVVRGYRLPEFAGEETLVIACSFSGNTEETLSAIAPLPPGSPNVVAITRGSAASAPTVRRASRRRVLRDRRIGQSAGMVSLGWKCL